MIHVFNSAMSDILAGLKLRRVWLALAYEDVGDQHRLTTLGPLWLLVNYLAFAATFIFIFHPSTQSSEYAAYVAVGLLVWLFISETLTLGVTLFQREESFIKGTKLPLSVYVLRLTTQSMFRAGYAIIGCLILLFANGVPMTASWSWSLFGLLITLAVTPAAIILFAFTGAYFPDSQFIVGNLVRLGMFVTPVFWQHAGEGGIRGAFYAWNPFTYFLEIVRLPILTGEVPLRSISICIGIGAAVWTVALFVLGSYRRDVVFAL